MSIRLPFALALLGFCLTGCALQQPQVAPIPTASAAPPRPLVEYHAALPFAPGSAPLHAAKIYKPGNVRKDCPPEGTAKPDGVKAVNILKNRIAPPAAVDFDHSVTIAAMLARGDDENRWEDSHAATIVGYVREVKPGGKETCNCGATALEDRDTHIELIPDPTHDSDAEVVIVEVTPRWRDFAAANQVDWSTSTLKASIKGKWVKVTGWMMFDYEHENNSENTEPANSKNWRGTAWEIHPITQIEVVPAPH